MSSRNRRFPSVSAEQAGEPGSSQPLGTGPRPAFEDVYRSTFRRVWGLLRRLGIPARHQPDVTQETFFRVARRLDTYDPSVDLLAWVFKLANHAATHHRRLARNQRELLVNEEEGLADSRWDRLPTGEGQDPERHVAEQDHSRLVARLVQTIEDRRARLVFVMHDLEQTTIADIARALDIPESTAQDRLVKGRKGFRAAVNSLDPQEREALGIRRSRVIPLFPLDRARLAEAEQTLDERLAEIQAQIWDRLQARGRGAGDERRPPGGAGQRAMGRAPVAAGQALVAGLLVFLAGAVVGTGLLADLPRAAPGGDSPAVIASPDVVSADATTPPADSTAGAAASPAGAAPRRSNPTAPTPSSPAAAIPRAGGHLGHEDDEDILLNRARVHLARNTPRPDLAITSLRLHAQKAPNSPRAPDRESLLRGALALTAQAKYGAAGAAGATTNPTPGEDQ